MIKKIIWILILFLALFILFIFQAPSISDKIGSLFGIEEISTKVTNIKASFDKIMTNMPSEEDIEGAKDDFVKGVNITKDKIDTIRQTLSGAEDTINNAKDFIDDASGKINEIKDTIEDVKEIGENIGNLTSGTGSK